MVQVLSIIFFSWISSIFVGFFKSSRFFVSLCTICPHRLTVLSQPTGFWYGCGLLLRHTLSQHTCGTFRRYVQRITPVARMIGGDGLHAGVNGTNNDITSFTRVDVGKNMYRADVLNNTDVTTDGSLSFRRKLRFGLNILDASKVFCCWMKRS